LPPPPGYQRKGANAGDDDDWESRGALAQIGGISILKPKPLGGVTGYNLNTGDKAWWVPNGGTYQPTSSSPLFKGVTIPPAAGRGMAQVITTKSLVIYGTGRGGGVPGAKAMLYAVDKGTGKQVGAVAIPSRTTAVPMTFLHQGRQYVVFATGAGNATSLVALALPSTPVGPP
jgi:quinoprotein glucose dehydrogenase